MYLLLNLSWRAFFFFVAAVIFFFMALSLFDSSMDNLTDGQIILGDSLVVHINAVG